MFNFSEKLRLRRRRHFLLLAMVTVFVVGCGPTDYQQPIADFKMASSQVIVSANDFYCNYNFLEVRNSLSQTAVQGGEIKLKATDDNLMTVDVPLVIDQKSIDVRTKALTVLAKYIANLAELASGKPGEAVGKQTTALSKTLDGTIDDAKKLADLVDSSGGDIISNSKFASLASPVSSAIGAVAQLIVNHKSRQEIERSLAEHEGDINNLIDLLSKEMSVIYERQKSNLRLRQMEASRIYRDAVGKNEGLAARISASDQIVAAEREVDLLRAANPQPAIKKMKNTFDALVAYAKSDKDPKTIADLFAAVEDFVSEAQPLGAASHALVAALQ